MKCADILKEAATLVGGARNDQHGDKHDNFTNIARYWNAHLHAKGMTCNSLDAEDVALMMVLLKVARSKTGSFNKDDYLDLCGYGGIAFELADIAVDAAIDPGDGYVKG